MRTCPICQTDKPNIINPRYAYDGGFAFGLFGCRNCGMVFVDAPSLQPEWFQHYYTILYHPSDGPYSANRLDNLADCVAGYHPETILDIGGLDGDLQQRLQRRGLTCESDGVIPTKTGKYDAVVLSHTLEHVYDVPGMMDRIRANVSRFLFLEVPIWLPEADREYDHHWQHINKFTPFHLDKLMLAHGFKVLESRQIDDYLEYHVWRMVARLGDPLS